MTNNQAFDLLSGLRQEALELEAQGLAYSAQSAGVKYIAFVVNGINFFCDARDVKEVAVCEGLMVVPQSKAWMRGLVNSKGVLYSVSDLSLFAGYGRATSAKKGHLLLLQDKSMQSALLVNRVIGFRYFDDEAVIEDIEGKSDTLDGLASYVNECFVSEGQDWYQLDIVSLLGSEQFGEVQ